MPIKFLRYCCKDEYAHINDLCEFNKHLQEYQINILMNTIHTSLPSAVFMKPCSRIKASPRRTVWSLNCLLELVMRRETPSCGTRPANVWLKCHSFL